MRQFFVAVQNAFFGWQTPIGLCSMAKKLMIWLKLCFIYDFHHNYVNKIQLLGVREDLCWHSIPLCWERKRLEICRICTWELYAQGLSLIIAKYCQRAFIGLTRALSSDAAVISLGWKSLSFWRTWHRVLLGRSSWLLAASNNEEGPYAQR